MILTFISIAKFDLTLNLVLYLLDFSPLNFILVPSFPIYPFLLGDQVRQAELEQNNMELSIGITERQREITRLKILQEQVKSSPHIATLYLIDSFACTACQPLKHLSSPLCIQRRDERTFMLAFER